MRGSGRLPLLRAGSSGRARPSAERLLMPAQQQLEADCLHALQSMQWGALSASYFSMAAQQGVHMAITVSTHTVLPAAVAARAKRCKPVNVATESLKCTDVRSAGPLAAFGGLTRQALQ